MRLLARFVSRKSAGLVVSTLALVVAPGQAGIAAAQAEERAVTTEDRAAATRAFEEGERAYRAGDFSRAAERFEEAYQKAPHPAPLWNAARSWDKAGEVARAANAYARYLREAPERAPDRDAAGKALAELATKLGRIEVFAPEAEEVRVDDQPLEGTSVYVHPGTHVIKGRVRGVSVQRTEALEAGGVRSVALVAENIGSAPKESPKEPPRPIAKAPRPPATITTAPREGKPWLVPALVASGAATLVSTGLMVWSGVDTLSARSDFDAAPSWDKLDEGRDKQFRTNVLIGVSLGLGAITGVLGSIWLAGQRGKDVKVGFGAKDAVRRSEAPSVELKITPPVLGGPAFVGATGSF
ncbi:tetratricopeptide repeat protein [Polyangium jinanense]|uniref:Tetratricopeptide repeat protein n=1 Tax=Polyangium jinanense TaxID=2829994 RepID=A0A9X3XBL3_9BACT|nr:tetratricopeptide repeat protein [Polyangium jinanense]MDC3955995.1 hypothetical protein [Polyangium jinanense]MDC3961498.1 hypothetical protein [Polyangium jinanense]MDC3986355.1 hypothetical protein [Polyangium jinanense]